MRRALILVEENLGDQEDQIIDLKSLENKNSYYKLLNVIWIVFGSLRSFALNLSLLRYKK